MRRTLNIHPDSRSTAVRGIEVTAERLPGGVLGLGYAVSGAIGALCLSAQTTPARTDELWRHTCFEAFLRAGDGYCEFNFAPSTQWAAYRFDGYRAGMRPIGEAAAPQIDVQTAATSLALRVHLDLGELPELPRGARWQLGLSAVIEEKDGGKSYWALAHPPGRPDFHRSDGFALELA